MDVIAPGKTPRRGGERVKTDRWETGVERAGMSARPARVVRDATGGGGSDRALVGVGVASGRWRELVVAVIRCLGGNRPEVDRLS